MERLNSSKQLLFQYAVEICSKRKLNLRTILNRAGAKDILLEDLIEFKRILSLDFYMEVLSLLGVEVQFKLSEPELFLLTGINADDSINSIEDAIA